MSVTLIPARWLVRLGSAAVRLDPIALLDGLAGLPASLARLPRMFDGVELLIAGVGTLLGRVEVVLAGVEETLASVGPVVAAASTAVDRVPPLLDSVSSAVDRVPPLLDSVSSAALRVDELVVESDRIRASIAVLADGLAPVLAGIDPALVANLDRALVSLGPVLGRLDDEVIPAVTSLEALVPAVDALNTQVQQLQVVVGEVGAMLGGIPGAARLRKRAAPHD